VLAFDDRLPIAALLKHVFDFGAYESCGKCTPCRLGTARLERIFSALAAGEPGNLPLRAETQQLVDALRRTSLCGHGGGLGDFAASALKHYRKELAKCWG
jgi:NADH:ubiquinone oxidoreductase subunit F (NADH-binding)